MIPILDRLILSGLSDAHDPFALEHGEIHSILYFGDGGMFPDDIKLYHRSAGPGGALSDDQIDDGVEFLRESLRAGRRVLAIGTTGATLAAAYLTEVGFDASEALRRCTSAGAPKPDAARVREHEERLRRRAANQVHSRDRLAAIA